MPLIQGASVESFKTNYYTLLREKGDGRQAYAIAADIARKNAHKVGKARRFQILRGQFFG